MNSRIKILIKTFFKLDFRDKENSGKKKFIGIFISYLFANSILSFNNYNTFNKESFIILSLSTGIFLLVFIVLNDFGNLFFAKRHLDLINILPVSSSELVLGKFISAYIYLALYSLIIVAPQVLFFSLYGSKFPEIFLFTAANLCSLFFITGIILAIYTVSVKALSGKSNLILYFFQFIFFFYVIFTSSLASRISLDKTDFHSIIFLRYLPQFYFASSINKPVTLAILVLLTVLLYVLYYLYIKRNYLKISRIIYEYNEKPAGAKNRKKQVSRYNELIYKRFIKNAEEKASYCLIANQLSNSKSLKLRFVPLIFLPVIVCLIAVFTDSASISVFGKTLNNLKVLSPSISFTFIMCFRLLISATKFEDENSSNIDWIYSALPISSPKRIINANIKFVFANFVIPVTVILFIILSFKFPLLPLLYNLAFILSASSLMNSLFLLFDSVYPFSIESTRYNSVSKLGEILFIMVIGIAIFVTQIFVFENVIFVNVSILLFLVISVLLKKKSFTFKSINN